MIKVKKALGIIVILALLASSATFFTNSWPAAAQDGESESFTKELAKQLEGVYQQKQSLTPVQRKIDSTVLQVIRKVEEQVSASAEGKKARLQDLSTALLKVDDAGNIDVKLTVTSFGDEQLGQLQDLGMDIGITLPKYGIIEGSLPYSQVEAVAGLDFVVNVGTPGYAVHNTGDVNSEGDTVLRAAEARAAFGVDGSGVKVGVISDGVSHLSASVASGDLPSSPAVDVLKAGSGDEGTAMLEIVHDLAPGAPLAFYSPDTSSDMVAGIGALETAGCNVIVDDLGWSDEPKFEDGPIAEEARDFYTGGGVYVTSAGNSAQRHYIHQYVRTTGPGGDYPYAHDYGSGDIGNTFTVPNGGTITTILQWNNQRGLSGDDFDLFLVRSSDGGILAGSVNIQDGNDNPWEGFDWTNNTGSPVTVYIAVFEYSLDNPPTSMVLDYHVWYAPTLQYSMTVNSVIGHSAVEEVLSTAAAAASTPGTIESFSSRGPGTIYFPTSEERQVPNITGVDGVHTTGPGDFPDPFYGTSASAPHVAAIAALVWEADPTLTPSEVSNAITSTAVDLGSAGYDYTWGFGRVDAYEAVASVIPSDTPPEVTNVTAAQSSPTVDITYDVTDAEQSDVTISFEYWDGDSWEDCVTTTGEGSQSTGTGKSGTWNAKTDFDGHYLTDCKIKVTADDGQAANNTGSDESSEFILDTKDPTGYGCDTPANGATGISIDPNLTCITASDDSPSVSYYFQLAEDDIFTVGLQESSWQSSTTWSPSTLSYSTQYFWRVQAKDAYDNETDYGSTFDFTTESVPDTAPPYTSGHAPAPGATDVPIDTSIVVYVMDDGDGVDIATIAMIVEGASVTPVVTGTPADYTLTYDPPVDFAYLQVVDVTVDASDLASPGNDMTQDVYSFTCEAAPDNPPDAPDSPLCEGVTNPTGVNDPAPEFGWTFSDPDGGDAQGAYQILVASTSGNLAANNGDMWDSGKVLSSASEVSYNGTALADNQTYYWKIKTWDNHDAGGPYCGEQQFTTGTSPTEVWVDDSWAGSSHGDPVDGHTFGTDAFATIQDGIDAVAGSTVHAAAGTYYENITLKDGVEVLGAGAGVTTINGGDSGSVVTATGVGPTTKLDGFTITRGYNAEYGGGGMYNDNSSPTVTNCAFSGNTAALGGGGMYNENDSSPTVTNCTFSGNTAVAGGGMFNIESSPTVTNCTFSGNTTGAVDGMYNYNSSPAVTNCILWDSGDEIYNDGTSTPVVTFCDVQGGYSGAGNIDIDPMFVNPATDDYHLQPGSPCVDTGYNDAATAAGLITDFEGDPRIVDGDGDTVAVVDMGADEYYPDIRTLIDPIDFGDIAVDSNQDNTTIIYSDGTGALTINSVTRDSGSDEFSYIGPVTPFDIAVGQSQAITIRFAPISEGLKSAVFNVNSNDPDEPDVTFDVSGTGTPPPPAEAVTEFALDLDDDDASGGRAGITEVRDPTTGDPLSVLVGGYQAEFSYIGSIVNVLEVRLKSPLDTGASSINNPGGLTQFNGIAATGASAPVELAFLTMRLIGSVDQQCQGTLTFTNLVDVDGEPLGISPSEISYNFRRGDARADEEVDISDALFIAQYLAGSRDLGDGLDKVQAVNAGSVRHDDGFDEINISDVLFICQYLAEVRDGNMNLIE